jgi:hypothetical protein
MSAQSAIPSQLRPVIRLRLPPGDGDPYVRLLRRYAALLPGYTEAELRTDVPASDAAATLLDLSDGEAVLVHLNEEAKASLRARADMLTHFVEPHLPADIGSTRLFVTCLGAEQQGFAAGTVVMERASELITEQYIFPHVRIDLESGKPALVGLAARPSVAARVIHPLESTGLQPVHTGLSVLLSVAPFLPPPWGAFATGGLTILNMIFDHADKLGQPHTSPYEELRKQLENFIIGDDLRADQGILLDVGGEFAARSKTLTTPLDQLTSWDDDLVKLQKYIDGEALSKLRTAGSDIWTILNSRTTHNFGTALNLMISAVDLRLLLESASTQLEALQASVAQKNSQLDRFNSLAKTWMEHVNTISELIGQHAEPASWTDDSIKTAMENTPWIPRIEAWMEKAKRDRMKMISPATYRYLEPYMQMPDPKMRKERRWGWTWTDTDVSTLSQEFPNAVFDTHGSCCSTTEHKTDADQALTAHRTEITTQIDTGFAQSQLSVKGWRTYVDSFKELLPYAPPAAKLQVAAKKDGPALPHPPFWVQGARMQYALVAVNTKGPSLRGPWSDELKVTTNAFATLSGFPPMTGIDSLRIMRQVAPPGGAWGNERTVGVMLAPGAAQFDDTNDDD